MPVVHVFPFSSCRPCQYDTTGKFVSGKNPRKIAFPKAAPIRNKTQLTPGPGSYRPSQSIGKQVLSTKPQPMIMSFPKADRPTLIPPGTTDIGPGEYKPPSAACEVQSDSRKPTCATIKFGEGYRPGQASKKFDFAEPAPGYVFRSFCSLISSFLFILFHFLYNGCCSHNLNDAR